MPASSSTSAPAAAPCFVRRRATAACTARMAMSHARPFRTLGQEVNRQVAAWAEQPPGEGPLTMKKLSDCRATIWMRFRVASFRNAPEPTVGCLPSMFPVEQLPTRLAARGRTPAPRPFLRAIPSSAAAPSGAARPRSDRGSLPALERAIRRPSATARPRTTFAARR